MNEYKAINLTFRYLQDIKISIENHNFYRTISLISDIRGRSQTTQLTLLRKTSIKYALEKQTHLVKVCVGTVEDEIGM